jgi:hypothetical protein
MPVGAIPWLQGIACLTPLSCVAAGISGTVVSTVDGGATWPRETLPFDAETSRVTCIDGVCFVNGNGWIYANTGLRPETIVQMPLNGSQSVTLTLPAGVIKLTFGRPQFGTLQAVGRLPEMTPAPRPELAWMGMVYDFSGWTGSATICLPIPAVGNGQQVRTAVLIDGVWNVQEPLAGTVERCIPVDGPSMVGLSVPGAAERSMLPFVAKRN